VVDARNKPKAEIGSIARFPFGPNYHKEMNWEDSLNSKEILKMERYRFSITTIGGNTQLCSLNAAIPGPNF
jgi:hypothetical protein